MNKHNRRRFLRTVAVAAAIAPAAALPEVASGGEQPPAAPTAAQALTDLAKARFGKHLSEAQAKIVQSDVTNNLRVADLVQRSALDSADEPATVFIAEPE